MQRIRGESQIQTYSVDMVRPLPVFLAYGVSQAHLQWSYIVMGLLLLQALVESGR